MKRLFGAVLATSLIAGCAFDNSETDPNRQRDLKNREKLLRAYKSIQGVYEGEFVTPSRIEEVRLTISYTEIVVGKGEDGDIRYQPELRGKFTRLSRDLLDTYMTASYDEDMSTNNLTLTTESSGGEVLYIRGTMAGETFSAPVLNSNGNELGRMKVNLKTREVIAPGEGTDNETYDRIKARLRPYVGEYIVKVVPLREGHKKFDVDLMIRIEDVSSNGLTIPTLAAYSRRTDGLGTVGRHTITYDSSRTPVQLTFNPVAGANSISNWTLTANWNGNGFKGEAIYPVYPASFTATRRPGSDGDNPKLPNWLQPSVDR